MKENTKDILQQINERERRGEREYNTLYPLMKCGTEKKKKLDTL